jgi:hypothetical protein
VIWAATFLSKFVVNVWVYLAEGLTDDEKASILGVMRIVLGFPPYAILLAVTVWAVRRYLRATPTSRCRRDDGRQRSFTVGAFTEDHRPHVVFDLGGAHEDQFVAGLEGIAGRRRDHPLAAQNRHQRRVSRQRDVAHRAPDVRAPTPAG